MYVSTGVETPQTEVVRPGPASFPRLTSLLVRFVRAEWGRIAAVSIAALIPCFWHREIEAADLGSHVYNAWLAQLIHRGQVHGLWIDHRWNNILFDYLLSAFGSVLSLRAAERIAVALSVLIFFWGIFALVCAATRRAPWNLLPLMAMISYGWTFEMGFFNYYLALGLSFWALAILWRGAGSERLIALAIAPFIVLAHPLGLFWLAGTAAYVLIAERLQLRYHILLLLTAAAGLFGVHEYLGRRYVLEPPAEHFFFFYNGADQLLLFGDRYRILEGAALLFVAGALAVDLVRRWREPHFSRAYIIPLQLYVLMFVGVALLPRGIHVPGHIGAIALLTERLTSVSAVLLCCFLGAMRPSRWHLGILAAIAVVFFAFVYQDTGKINAMENEVARLVRTLTPSQRVMGTILAPEESRVSIQHILDRACIGYCFSYGNYEPGCKMFRVRALPGNPYVLSNYTLAVDMEDGDYVVKPADLPVYQVYQCGELGAQLCIHALEAGEENDDLGVHPGEKEVTSDQKKEDQSAYARSLQGAEDGDTGGRSDVDPAIGDHGRDEFVVGKMIAAICSLVAVVEFVGQI